MSLSEHVSLTITEDSVGVARAGFGVPLIPSYSASWVERVRSYASIAEVAADGFATDSPEYLAANAMFAQSPHPKTVKIGRCALAPTQSYTLVPIAHDSHTYSITVKGEDVTEETVTFTSDSDATVAEICAGLETALNAVVGKNFTAVDNTTDVTVTGDNAGDWFSLEVASVDDIDIVQDHADPGIATDLAAIALEDNEWYGLCTTFNSESYCKATAAWVESAKKLYICDTNESATITVASDGTQGLLDDLMTLAYARTAGIYHPSPAAMAAAAWLGKCLPVEPGGQTWAYKTLAGVAAVNLTSTHRANIIARNASWYQAKAGVNITFAGTTADGDYIDATRGDDWLEDDMTKSVFETFAGESKVPFTDEGVAQIEGVVRGSLQRAEDKGILVEGSSVVTVPKVADVPTADKTARNLPDVKFSATRAGAIHKAAIVGVISL